MVKPDTIPPLLLLACLLGSPGCISYKTSESTDTKTREIGTEISQVSLSNARVDGSTFRAQANLKLLRELETTRITTVTGDVSVESNTIKEIDKDPFLGLLISPVMLAADMVGLVFSGPEAFITYLFADTGSLDPVVSSTKQPVTAPLASGKIEVFTQGAGPEQTHQLLTNGQGAFSLDLASLASEAVVGPLARLRMTVRATFPDGSVACSAPDIQALKLLQIIEYSLSGDTPTRRRVWTQLRDRSSRDVRVALSRFLDRGAPNLYFSRLKTLTEIPPLPVASAKPKPTPPKARPTPPRVTPPPTVARRTPVPAKPIRSTPPTAPNPGVLARRTFVLIVGINGYSDPEISPLRFAEADARAMFGFYATNDRSPTERDRVKILLGAKATRVAVLQAIREHLVKKATRPTDAAVLYFAGHGFSDAEETYLACADTQRDALMETGIPQATLQGYWNRIGAGTKLLFTDACHSGGLANLRGLTIRKRVVDRTAGRISAVIAAAGANELSAEDEELGQGVFTQVLLHGLRGNADRDRSGTVTLGELEAYLKSRVPLRAREVEGKQTPVVEIHGAGGAAIPLTR